MMRLSVTKDRYRFKQVSNHINKDERQKMKKEMSFINERTTKLIVIAQESPALSLLEIFAEYPSLDASFFSIFELTYVESRLESKQHLIEIRSLISANFYELAITDFGKAEQYLDLFNNGQEVELHTQLSAFLHLAVMWSSRKVSQNV